MAWLAGLQVSGAAAALAARAAAAGRMPGILLALLCIGVIALGCELVSLPFVFYRAFLLERKYGLSSEPLSTWLADHVKALGLGLALTILAGVAVFAALPLPGGA